MTEAKHRWIGRSTSADGAVGQLIEPEKVVVDNQLREVLERDQQRAASEVLVRNFPRRKFPKLPPGLGTMNQDR